MTVSSEQRSGLSRAVSRLRSLFEADFELLMEGTFGIHVAGRRAGEIEDVSALSLSAHELAARAELVGVVVYLRGEGLGPVDAVERMLREAVFTMVNRLLAIRVAEAIGVLPPSLAEGSSSLGFVELLEVFPLLRDADDSGGYWSYLQVCGDELSHAVPRLFDRRHPLSALEPSSGALDAAVEALSDPDLADVWVEPEALGWSYQFFNTQEERRTMRDESSAPRDSRELAVRNQFFTPGYVVDFLVENTLGRRLRESGSELVLPLLLGEVDEDAPPLDLDDVSVLDPAVGSGHFLLGTYDLLERAWEEKGLSADEAAPRILGSLYGVDIDPRAAQVAQVVLYLRARRSAPDGVLDPPRIVTARALPKDPEVWEEVLADAPPAVRDIVEGLGEVLELAPVLGSLLKPEEYLRETIGERLDTPRLGDEALGSFEDVEKMVLDAAERIASEAAARPAERLFAADASDALGFVDIVTRRYDTILMNPPFGEPVPTTQEWLKREYAAAWTELYGCFLIGGLQRLTLAGTFGALTSSQYFTTRRLRGIRSLLIDCSRPLAIVDLGPDVLEHATVSTALTVLRDRRPVGPTSYIDAAVVARSDDGLVGLLESSREWDVAVFDQISGHPFAFHVPKSVIELWKTSVRFEPDLGIVRKGSATFDDFRFVRAWWELGPNHRKSGWTPFPKGGSYRPFWSSAFLVVDWRDDGRGIRGEGVRRHGSEAQAKQSSRYWGRAGISFAHVSSVGFNARVLPSGQIFSSEAISVFPEDDVSATALLALLNSRSVEELIQVSGRSRKYETSSVKRLPIGREVIAAWEPQLDSLAGELIAGYRGLDASDETSPVFAGTMFGLSVGAGSRVVYAQQEATDCRLSALHDENDKLSESILGLTSEYMWIVPKRSDLLPSALREFPRSASELGTWLVAYVAGCALGRWDVRIGRDHSLAPGWGDPFDPLPVCPPGMLTGDDGLPATEAPEGYPLVLPPDRILHDDPGHRWDIVRAVEATSDFLFDDPDRELREALGHVKANDLRSYLRGKFFPQHLSRYSKSRRKAPIYWYLAVPSRQWGLWAYAPWLSREQLFAVARAAQEKLRRLADEAGQLRHDLEAGADRGVRERLESVEELSREVAEFYERAEAVAQSGWEPDLNDGIILNAAPLEELFADVKWRKNIAKHREKMENGEYPWATVQQTYFDRLES